MLKSVCEKKTGGNSVFLNIFLRRSLKLNAQGFVKDINPIFRVNIYLIKYTAFYQFQCWFSKQIENKIHVPNVPTEKIVFLTPFHFVDFGPSSIYLSLY